MRIGKDRSDTYFRRLQQLFCRRVRLKCRRMKRSAYDVFSAIECVEERLCLSASIPQLDTTAVVSAPIITTQVGGDGFIYHRLGNPQNASPMHGQGGVALEGGGSDVDQAFQWMISRMGGKGDFLVLSATDDTGYDSYIYQDLGGANSVSTLVIPNRAAALDPAVQKIILSADAIFIEGGSQNRYIDWWQGTPVQQAIGTDIAHGVPIGGTSAGTDVLGQFIYSAEYDSISSTQAMANPFDPNMTFDQNFVSPNLLPFLNNTVVDTHFEARDRLGRLVSFLGRVNTNGWSSNHRPMGIGIDVGTALLISPNGTAQVVGNYSDSSVDFLETPGLPQVDQPGQSLTYTSILEDHVTVGGSFNLSNWNASFSVNNSYTTHYTVSVTQGVLSQIPQVTTTASVTTQTPPVILSSTSNSPKPSGFTTANSSSALVPFVTTTATSFTPTSFSDSYASVSGTVVSLRDAVIAANNSATGTVTINLKAGTYSLSLPQGGQEDGTNGNLVVSNKIHTLVINGTGTSGSGATMIDATLLKDRIFQLLPGVTVVLNNLILTGGVATDDGVAGVGPAQGGAILDNGKSLTLNNVWVVGNTAKGTTAGEDAQGGGIYLGGGNLSIYKSLIATNTALGGSSSSSGIGAKGGNGQGGGLYAAAGSITLGSAANPDKIESNRALGGSGSSGPTGGSGGNAQGGGIYVGGGTVALSLNMTHAVISTNFAQAGTGGSGKTGVSGNGGSAQGAGLYVSGGSVSTVVNSSNDSFQSNRASGGRGGPLGSSTNNGGSAQGAGIYFSGGVLNLSHDNLSNNVALGGNGDQGGAAQGGAIFVGGGTVSLGSNVLASNVALGGAVTNGAGPGGAGQGAGLYANAGSLTLTGNLFASNTAFGGSGGDFTNWSSGGWGGLAAGGGIYANGDGINLSSIADVFLSNSAVGGRGGNGYLAGSGGTGQGGAALFNVGSLLVKLGTIASNSAIGGLGGQGGANGHGGTGGAGEGGGMFVNRDLSQFTVSLISDTLVSNKAQGGAGGGVIKGGIVSSLVVIGGNVGGTGGAGLGGGLFLQQVQPPLRSDVIVANSIVGGAGGSGKTNGPSGLSSGKDVYTSILTPTSVALHPPKLNSDDSAGK